MTNEYFKKVKRGDIIHFKCGFGLDGIGIFDKTTSDGVIHLYCVNYKDLKDCLFFITYKSHQRCIFNIDSFTHFELASDDEMKKLYKLIFEQYKYENGGWSEYITDSTYYEIQDWFAYKCGCEFNDDNGYPDFIYEFSQYTWELIMKDIGYEEKEEPKMVNLDDVCKWIKENIDLYADIRTNIISGYQEIFLLDNFEKELRKAMEK